MKLLSLHINQFGHFSEADFNLNGTGVQVLFGPNEAGKTTLLAFMRELLFGFKDRENPYDFGTSAPMAGTATMRLADGRALELRRRKGRRNTVSVKIDGHETDLDEDGFSRLLGNANRNLFSSVFAVGLKELSQGEESLRHESLRSALYGGGLAGVASPEGVLAALEEQAETLFKPRASNPPINALCKELTDLAKQVKDKSILPKDYEERANALKTASEKAEALKVEVDNLRREHSSKEKLKRALPRWLELQRQRRLREGLSVPPGFPADGKDRFEKVKEIITGLVDTKKTLLSEIEDLGGKLQQVPCDRLIAQKAVIERCNRAILSVEEARRDLPGVIAGKENTHGQVARDLAELRPDWNLNDLKNYQVTAAGRAEIDALVKERQELTETRTDLKSQRKTTVAALDEAKADLAALGELADVSALSATLVTEADYNGNLKALKDKQRELLKLQPVLSARLAKLSPPLPTGLADPHLLPVPRKETVSQYKRELADQTGKVQTAEQSLREAEERRAALEKKLAELLGLRKIVPSPDELRARRSRRDTGWRLIRRQFIDGKDCGAEIATWVAGQDRALPEAYEEGVRVTDQYADLMYKEADVVAQREQTDFQLKQALSDIEKKGQTVAELRKTLDDTQKKWNALWQPCDLVPLEPDAMETWIDDHQALVGSIAKREELQGEQQTLQQLIEGFESSVRAAVPGATGDFAPVLAAARQAVKTAQDRSLEHKTLNRAIQRSNRRLRGLKREWAKLRRTVAHWTEQWRNALGRLKLPVDWTSDLAGSVIERLLTTRDKLDSLGNAEQRIEAMQKRIATFEEDARKLCDAVAPDQAGKLAEVAVAILHDRLSLATALEEKNKNLVELERQIDEAQSQRGTLLALARVTSDEGFTAVAECAKRISEIESEIAKLESESDLIRENEGRVEFEANLGKADMEVLQGEVADLQDQLTKKEKLKTEAENNVGSCRNSLSLLDGSDEAAELQQRLARKRAQLAGETHRYVPLVLARRLLQETVRRFERDNQPAMLADVTRLFAAMTGGRYVGIERPTSAEHSFIVRLHDGRERTPDQLSDGTREQLYLAIRLAYVLHYCRQSEPLPIILDDALANFDVPRAERTLLVLADLSRAVQVLLFTCHPHLVELARKVFPACQPLTIPEAASLTRAPPPPSPSPSTTLPPPPA